MEPDQQVRTGRRVARSVTLDDERAHSGIAAQCSPCSVSIRPLVRHRPTEPLEVFFDVHRAPVSHSTVRAMRGGPLSSFTLPTIQDHSNVRIVVEGSRQICVELLITTRNDVEKPWHRPAPPFSLDFSAESPKETRRSWVT